MRILLIPDVHQSNTWKSYVFDSGLFKDYDKVIQLGDWFDCWKPDWKYNMPIKIFNDAINLSNKYKNFDVLLGNHDFSYISSQHCSGYQNKHANEIYTTLFDSSDYVNIVKEYDGWVFSHAGVSSIWMDETKLTASDQINQVFHDLTIPFYKEEKEFRKHCEQGLRLVMKNLFSKDELINSGFHLSDRDYVLFNESKQIANNIWGSDDIIHMKKSFIQATSFEFNGIDCYGDDSWQTPIWIRPNSLIGNMYFPKQVVGHTEYENLVDIKKQDKRLVVIDSKDHNFFIELDTETDNIKLV